MDYAESKRRILVALDGRPVSWLARKLGYSSDEYVRLMISGAEPVPDGFYDDVAAILRVQPREITPTVGLRVTFARPGARRARAAALSG